MKKFTEERPYADPEAAARKLVELAADAPAVQGRPYLHRADQRAVYVQPERQRVRR
ncbi:hypothetical protein [Bradyrhizobium sp. 134]|uniref:hypothetical protein n=1 Tax=unclassified Bradyrhizobium TaxID=2631580 RepID=UPI003209D02F